jgi:MFS family permease
MDSSRVVIVKYYLYRATTSRGFIIPVWILFLRSRGLSFTQIGLLEAIFFATITVSEIPTGYVGDWIGRRNSLICSSILVAVSFVGFGFAHSFAAFIVPYLVWGIGDAFQSGSSDAWLYDMLTDRLSADDFTRIHGRGTTVYLLVVATTAILGGFFGSIDLYYPIVATIGVLVVNILILLGLPKNPQYSSENERETVPVSQALSTMRIELTQSTLRSFVLYVALLFAVITAVTVFIQPISIDLGIHVSQLGFLYAGFRLLSAGVSYYTETIRNSIGIRGWLYTVPFVLGGLYVGAWFLPLMILPAFFLMDMIVRITRTFGAQYINDSVSSVNRATLLSAASMIYTAVRIPFIAVAGMLADTYTQFVAVAILGAILIGGSAFLSVIEAPVITERTEQLSD